MKITLPFGMYIYLCGITKQVQSLYLFCDCGVRKGIDIYVEIIIISIFCTILVFCIILDISVLYALTAGLVLFCVYGRLKGFSFAQLAKIIISGIKTTKNILIVFVLIGMLTALWRACGTIPATISYVVRLISPSTLVLMAFLLNCGVSVLTGTSFGAAATMGVICMTMAVSMGISPAIVGGAVLSGIYFGDRCSPVSTSALLISELTATNIFDNVKLMLRSALVPFLLTCALYAVIGLRFDASGDTADLQLLFTRAFDLHWVTLLPAILILALSLFRINVKIVMLASIAAAVFLCLFVQHLDLPEVLRVAVLGYKAHDLEIGALLNGGGILSMLNVMMIVSISSAYGGLFQETGILNPVKKQLVRLGEKVTPFGGILFTSIAAVMVTCSQVLTIILTHQLWDEIETDSQKLAIHLENTAVVVAALIPWSIASAVPLTTIGAPTASLPVAFFLYLLPAYSFLKSLYSQKHDLSASVK